MSSIHKSLGKTYQMNLETPPSVVIAKACITTSKIVRTSRIDKEGDIWGHQEGTLEHQPDRATVEGTLEHQADRATVGGASSLEGHIITDYDNHNHREGVRQKTSLPFSQSPKVNLNC